MMNAIRSIPGSYWFRIESQRTGVGIPDVIGLIRGVFIAIECKRSAKEKPTKIQEFVLKNIAENGGIALVANPDNFRVLLEGLTHFAQTGELAVFRNEDLSLQ
jgi:hypothetical protein